MGTWNSISGEDIPSAPAFGEPQAYTMAKSTAESPTASTPIRFLLLAALPLIATLLYLDGQHYDPGLLDFKAAGNAESPADRFPDRIGDMERAGQVRRYDADNLYEYINGHAEYFIGAGFQDLAVGEYGDAGDGQPRVVINLYHLGKALNAFGALVQESGDQAPVEVGALGFRSGQGVSFIQGPYYVQISLFDPQIDALPAARDMAAHLARQVPATELGFHFPDFGPVLSTRFVRQYYRGMDFLNQVLERSYQRGDGEMQAFQVTGSEQEITALGDTLSAFLRDDGIPSSSEERAGLIFHRVEDPYEGEWFFVILPGQLLGVYSPLADDLSEAIARFATVESVPSQ